MSSGLQAESLFVRVGASTSSFSKAMGGITKDVERFSSKMAGLSAQTARIGVALTAPLAVALRIASKSNAQVAGELDKAKAAFGSLASELSIAILPVVRELSAAMQAAAAWIRSLSPALKDQIASWVSTAAKVALAAAALGQLASMTGVIAKGFGLLASALGSGLLLPVIGAVAAIAALILLAGYLREAWAENLGGIREKFFAVWKWITDLVGSGKGLLGAFLDTFQKAQKVLGDFLVGMIDQWQKAFALLGIDVSPATDLMKDLVKWGDHISSITGFRELVDDFRDGFVKAIDVGAKHLEKALHGTQRLMKDLGIDKFLGGASGSRAGAATGKGSAKASSPRLWESDSGLINHILAKRAIHNVDRVRPPPQLRMGGGSTAVTMTAADGLREQAARMKEAVANAFATVADAFMNAAGQAGQSIQNIVKAFASGGLEGGLMQIAAELIANSEGLRTLGQMLQNSFQMLADAFGAVLKPFEPLIAAVHRIASALVSAVTPIFSLLAMVLEPLVPPLMMVGTLLQGLAPLIGAFATALQMVSTPFLFLVGPAMRGLFEVLKFVGSKILWVAAGIGDLFNGVVAAVSGVLRWIAGFTIPGGARPFAFLDGLAASVDAAKVNTDAMRESMRSLENATWDSAMAAANATAEVLKSTDATANATKQVETFAGSLVNAPRMFKLALTRFNTFGMEGSDPFRGIPKFAKGGTVYGPTLAMVGEGGEPEHIIPDSTFRGMMNAPGGGRGGSSGGVTINIGPIVTDNPEKLVDGIEREMRRRLLRREGTSGTNYPSGWTR